MELPSSENPSVMVIGNERSAEFTAVRHLLDRCARLVSCRETTAAPKLVLYLQSRPGEVGQSLVEEVYQQYPCVPQLIVLGSWCEGEVRTGTPLANVERVYWYNAVARIERLLAKKPSAAFLRVESLNDAIDRSLRRVECSKGLGEAIVYATSQDDYQCAADLCIAAGYTPCWRTTPKQNEQLEAKTGLLIWNADNAGSPGLQQDLQIAAANHPRALRVVLANFPRRRTVQQAIANGGTHVFGKPFLLADVLSTLERFGTLHAQKAGDHSASPMIPTRHAPHDPSSIRVTA